MWNKIPLPWVSLEHYSDFCQKIGVFFIKKIFFTTKTLLKLYDMYAKVIAFDVIFNIKKKLVTLVVLVKTYTNGSMTNTWFLRKIKFFTKFSKVFCNCLYLKMKELFKAITKKKLKEIHPSSDWWEHFQCNVKMVVWPTLKCHISDTLSTWAKF